MLAEKLEEFRSKLLDKSRRNRLLNFKPKGNRSIHVFGQSAGELYQWLVNDKKHLSFAPREEWRPEESPTHNLSAPADSGQAPAATQPPTTDSDVPVKPMTGPPHRRNNNQTGGMWQPATVRNEGPPQEDRPPMAGPGQVLVDLEEEKLDRRLLFLAREAESAMQEQGCNILYASFGLLDWRSSVRSKMRLNGYAGRRAVAHWKISSIATIARHSSSRIWRRFRAMNEKSSS